MCIRDRGRRLSLEQFLAIVVFAQFAVIIILLASLSSEYQSSTSYKAWVDQNLAPSGFFLSNYIAPILVVILAVATAAFWNSFAERTRIK